MSLTELSLPCRMQETTMRWRESEYIKHNINKVGGLGTTGAVTQCCNVHLQP